MRLREIPRTLGFLDERQQEIVRSCAAAAHWERYAFYGGCPDAERAYVGLFPGYMDLEDQSIYPIAPVTFTFRPQDTLTHRDFLGTFMSLGIKRETVGDILVEEGRCVAFFHDRLLPLLQDEVKKVGGTAVRLSTEPPQTLPSRFQLEPVEGVVSSLRLDCVVALLTGKSRELSAQLIRTGRVTVNHSLSLSVSDTVEGGDRISDAGLWTLPSGCAGRDNPQGENTSQLSKICLKGRPGLETAPRSRNVLRKQQVRSGSCAYTQRYCK